MWLILFIVIAKLICPSKAQFTFTLDCGSSNPTDIIFGIDGSGSLGRGGFELEKYFVKQVSLSRLSNNTKMGYTLFATTVDVLAPLQSWNESHLSQFIDGLEWPAGYTNTAALIESAIKQFNETSESATERRLVIVTDGNPYLDDVDLPVCQYASPLQLARIKTAVIGFGDEKGNLEVDKVDCIADYFIPLKIVSNYDLTHILCPSSNSNNFLNTTSINTTGI